MEHATHVWAAHLAQRAGRINDPVKRLRFLRRAAGSRPKAARAADVGRRAGRIWIAPLLAVLLLSSAGTVSVAVPPVPAPLAGAQPPRTAAPPAPAWLVEQHSGWELFSSGLRIETALAVRTQPRLYRPLAQSPVPGASVGFRTEPAGMVFHSSEGPLASFEPQQTGLLRRQGVDLLAYARKHRLYHYVVDRFGRVHRLVEDSDVADHAGQSVWADADAVYLNLNASFLGLAFEARTGPGAEAALTSAQIHSGKLLSEMLRHKYGIPAENCVTHAQVSVNPLNFHIGYHSDWARELPFSDLGLPDNYLQPPPSVCLFGFAYDRAFFEAAGTSLRAALLRAEEEVRHAAAARSLNPARWRAELNRRYRQAFSQVNTERAVLEKLAAREERHP